MTIDNIIEWQFKHIFVFNLPILGMDRWVPFMPFNNIIDLIDSSSDSSSRRLPVLATMVQVFIPCPAQPDSWLLYCPAWILAHVSCLIRQKGIQTENTNMIFEKTYCNIVIFQLDRQVASSDVWLSNSTVTIKWASRSQRRIWQKSLQGDPISNPFLCDCTFYLHTVFRHIPCFPSCRW